MGSFLLAAGAKGKRLALPNSEIMIHQPLGGAKGRRVTSKFRRTTFWFIRNRMNRLYAEMTGQPLENIERDTERDNYMTAEDAQKYGLIDKVVTHR